MKPLSSTDSFWNAVEKWHSAIPKPLIRVEGSDSNWPALLAEGTVESFVRDKSIDFLWTGNPEPCTLDLSRCALRVVRIPLSLEESDVAARFSLACEEPDDSTTCFVFAELRGFGKPN